MACTKTSAAGPRNAIADRAGVERLTVYRHFPDEPSMLRACSAHWTTLHPLPPMPAQGNDPLAACRRTILRLYGWYRANEAMLVQITTDARKIPLIAELIAPIGVEPSTAAELDTIGRAAGTRRAPIPTHSLSPSLTRELRPTTRCWGVGVGWGSRRHVRHRALLHDPRSGILIRGELVSNLLVFLGL